MSLSSLLFIGVCWGMYRLGAFNERHPGQMWPRLRQSALWVWRWMNK